MRGYLLRRLPSALLVLLLASFLAFAVLRLVPGDPAAVLAGPDASAETEAAIRARLGLDDPLPAQYARWIGGLLTGDLGPSYAIGGETADLIGDGIGATVELTLGALLFVVVLGGVFGIVGATSRNRWLRGTVRVLTTGALAVPPFVTGVLLVLLFAVLLGVLPPGGRVPLLTAPDLGVQYLLLPALCLALPSAAVLGRYLKDSIERALAEDYVRTATAAGIAPAACSGTTPCPTPSRPSSPSSACRPATSSAAPYSSRRSSPGRASANSPNRPWSAATTRSSRTSCCSSSPSSSSSSSSRTSSTPGSTPGSGGSDHGNPRSHTVPSHRGNGPGP